MDKEKLFKENMNLVPFVIQKYLPTAIGDEDAIQAGYMGLWQSCLKYKEDKGQFSSYAVLAIKNEILHWWKYLSKQICTVPWDEKNQDNQQEDKVEDSINKVIFSEYYQTLTETQKKIVSYKLLGYNGTEIASILKVNPATVNFHLRKMLPCFKQIIN